MFRQLGDKLHLLQKLGWYVCRYLNANLFLKLRMVV